MKWPRGSGSQPPRFLPGWRCCTSSGLLWSWRGLGCSAEPEPSLPECSLLLVPGAAPGDRVGWALLTTPPPRLPACPAVLVPVPLLPYRGCLSHGGRTGPGAPLPGLTCRPLTFAARFIPRPLHYFAAMMMRSASPLHLQSSVLVHVGKLPFCSIHPVHSCMTAAVHSSFSVCSAC